MSIALAGDANPGAVPAPATRRPEKTEKILEAAGQLFRDQGYGAVSMDQIARDAGVSKATVYAHFESKERLFAAIIQNGCTAYAQGIVPEVKQLEDMREALTRISRSIEAFLLAPKTLGIYRVIIAEGPRFPELAQAFVQNGPLPFLKLLSDFFDYANKRGLLNVPNTRLAAHQLVWLVRGPLYMRRILNLDLPDEPGVDDVIAGAVEMMMKTYAPN
jgi:TetR/AcrR family transcriptional regulator, mexJK operon transcriptional repressor